MNYYLIAKFVHIVGALGMFVVLGIEWLSLRNLRQAGRSIAQIREWMRITGGFQRLWGISMVSILISGFYMMAVARMHAAWLIVAFGSLILMGVLAGVLTGRRMKAIQQSLQETDAVSSTTVSLLQQPLLWTVLQLRVAVMLGVVFLMTAKPDLIGSLLTMILAAILGLISARLSLRREQARKESSTKETMANV